MAEQTKIKIKRKTTPNTEPSTIQTVGAALDVGEPLFDTNTDRLYIGKNGESTEAAEFLPAKGKNDEYSISTSVEDGKNNLIISSDRIHLDGTTHAGLVKAGTAVVVGAEEKGTLTVHGASRFRNGVDIRGNAIFCSKDAGKPKLVEINNADEKIILYRNLLAKDSDGNVTTTISRDKGIKTNSIETDSIIIDSAQIDNNLTLGSSTKNATQKIYGNLEVTGTLTTKALNSTTTGSTNEFDSIKVTNDSTLVGKVTTGDIDASGHSITADEVTADVSESTVHGKELGAIIDSNGYADTANNLSGTPSLNVNSTKISVTAGGKTSSEVTVPYATSSTYSGMIDVTNTTGTVGNFKNIKQILLDMVYPVGSIYMSVNDKSPQTFLGGKWERWGQGRVPVGVGSYVDSHKHSTDAFRSPNASGGDYNHKLVPSEIPSHTHTYTPEGYFTGTSTTTSSSGLSHQHTFSTYTDTDGAHYHNGVLSSDGDSKNGPCINTDDEKGSYVWGQGSSSHTGDGSLIGVQASEHYHKVSGYTNFTNTSHTHTCTPQGYFTGTQGTTGAAGSDEYHSNVQPYITCYMWRRKPD